MSDDVRDWRVRQPLGVWWVLPAGLSMSLVLLVAGGLRAFGLAMGATLAIAAVVRLMTPDARAGGLRVRSRPWDVGLLLVLAAVTATLSLSLVIR